MSCVEIKHQLFRSYVMDDLATVNRLLQDYPQASKWATRFNEHSVSFSVVPSPVRRRLINNFCLGSDPEFAFARGTKKAAALQDCGLFVGLAAGADQNERLAELRPWPSTSAVEHVAGILTELRWMYRVHHTSRTFSWRAGAYFAGDGLGGHVHFGRKKETRDLEVSAMNSLALTLGAIGVFPLDEWAARRHGDARGQLYGQFGDIRPQAHGYEYRTMPSWLHSPDAAFLVLTASKLAMLDPEMIIPWAFNLKDSRQHLLRLAKYYRSRDDDALLMYNLLQQRLDRIVFDGGDFKLRWGFDNVVLKSEAPALERWILPSSIQPQLSEVEEMYRYLTGTVDRLDFAELPPNFVHKVPEPYVWAPLSIPAGRRAGAGDVIHNLVYHPSIVFSPNMRTADQHPLTVSLLMRDYWTPDEVKRFESEFNGRFAMASSMASPMYVSIPESLRKPPGIKQLRHLLFDSGLFPLWTVENVTKNSFAEWQAKHPLLKKKAATKSKEKVVVL